MIVPGQQQLQFIGCDFDRFKAPAVVAIEHFAATTAMHISHVGAGQAD